MLARVDLVWIVLNIWMKPRTVPKSPMSGAIWAIVAMRFNLSSSGGTSISPASSRASRTPSRPLSRLRMATLTRRATGPGVASQMESASTTLSRLSTLRTPLRNSVELIWARWQCRARSINTTTATALVNNIRYSTGPPLDNNTGNLGMISLYFFGAWVQRANLGAGRCAEPEGAEARLLWNRANPMLQVMTRPEKAPAEAELRRKIDEL